MGFGGLRVGVQGLGFRVWGLGGINIRGLITPLITTHEPPSRG